MIFTELQGEKAMTQHINVEAPKKKSLPLVNQSVDLDIDAELKKFEADERARLGLATEEQ